MESNPDEEEEVKLFVGQVPTTMSESDIFPYFSPFGFVKKISIVRDLYNNAHRGCAFVTLSNLRSAYQAINHLHRKCKFGDTTNFIQVRIADCNLELENKLFVGMLPKHISEDQLHSIFEPFGEIREVLIVRNPNKSSNGCAFVKYILRESAQAAIDGLHMTLLERSARPLVVKFANSRKFKLIDIESDIRNEMSMTQNQVLPHIETLGYPLQQLSQIQSGGAYMYGIPHSTFSMPQQVFNPHYFQNYLLSQGQWQYPVYPIGPTPPFPVQMMVAPQVESQMNELYPYQQMMTTVLDSNASPNHPSLLQYNPSALIVPQMSFSPTAPVHKPTQTKKANNRQKNDGRFVGANSYLA